MAEKDCLLYSTCLKYWLFNSTACSLSLFK